jgi:hypothetical protein
VPGGGVVEVCIDHPRFHHGGLVVRIHIQYPVHPFQAQDNRAFNGVRPAGDTRSGPAGHQRNLVRSTAFDCRLDVRHRLCEDHRERLLVVKHRRLVHGVGGQHGRVLDNFSWSED